MCTHSQPDIRDTQLPSATRGHRHHNHTGIHTPTQADRRADRHTLASRQHKHTPTASHPASHTKADVFAHPDTSLRCIYAEKQSTLPACAHTQTCLCVPSAQAAIPERALFPGPCCHTVETQHPPQSPRPAHPSPAQPSPCSHVEGKTKIWLGRGMWVARNVRGRR